jgi:hypothetical protein
MFFILVYIRKENEITDPSVKRLQSKKQSVAILQISVVAFGNLLLLRKMEECYCCGNI